MKFELRFASGYGASGEIIEINTLEDLIAVEMKYNEDLVFQSRIKYPKDTPTITVYDDYLE